ncbi:hypothetical protein [Variovorax sp. J22R115]|uniref:hypothetical protein n=1 Tax=Variovorax sp. J22R115 TaxID=3053509 RepID=UPI0025791C7E|nr:hypothetical protein [Variovorax sp. J22R115]MDM0050407.1 hypothetical protein [Variovorax sp. J22R115]
MKALSTQSRGAESIGGAFSSHAPDPLLPSETKAFWLQLGALGVVMAIGFVGWFQHVVEKPSAPARGTLVQTPEAPAPSKEVASSIPPPPPVVPRRASPPPVSAYVPTPEPRGAVASLPGAPVPDVREQVVKPPAADTVVSPRELSRDPEIQAVESFYRALSAADGMTAAAFVIPEKRGLGPFNAANISRFYGSFDRPLLIRSIRSINASLVEAKYSYRVSRTTCEGTAIVETERVGQETLIRRIHANC